MSNVIQVKCPGCAKLLRLPADWINQSIRCKHCGTVLQAKNRLSSTSVPRPSNPPAPPSATTPRTPPSPGYGASAVPGDVLTVQPVGPERVVAAHRGTTQPAAEAADFSALSCLEETTSESTARRRARARRRSLGPWVLAGLLFLVTLVAGGAVLAIVAGKMNLIPGWPALPPPSDSGGGTEKGNGPAWTGLQTFPRRALIISVNNYLYANPVNYGIPGHSVHTLSEKLANGLHIPKEQIGELSDAAPQGAAKPPMKSLIEKSIAEFLAGSRKQDRLLLLFIGHAAEIGDDVYLVPIEGELDNKDTLIPLSWLYEQLSKCEARQKVLVLDVARFNPGRGQERPGGGPMTAKIDDALKNPPEGVQVWSACVAEQSSYEFDNAATNDGMFIEALIEIFNKGLGGTIQKPEDAFPLAALETAVNRYLKEELDLLQKVQTSRLAGKEPADGAAPDPKEKMPPKVTIPTPALPGDKVAEIRLVRAILREIDVPSVKKDREDMRIRAESLPLFPAKALAPYAADGDKTGELQTALAGARAALQNQGDKERLQEYFNAPSGDKTAFNKELVNKGKQLGKPLFEIESAMDELAKVEKYREKEPPRWQADYDYILSRLNAQYAYLNEYSALLGQMRMDQQPALEPKVHTGWRVASQATVNDPIAKKHAKESVKILDRLIKDHPDTPWAVLAKRDRLTNLGLEWQPTK
jgi:hypothetical protein